MLIWNNLMLSCKHVRAKVGHWTWAAVEQAAYRIESANPFVTEVLDNLNCSFRTNNNWTPKVHECPNDPHRSLAWGSSATIPHALRFVAIAPQIIGFRYTCELYISASLIQKCFSCLINRDITRDLANRDLFDRDHATCFFSCELTWPDTVVTGHVRLNLIMMIDDWSRI